METSSKLQWFVHIFILHCNTLFLLKFETKHGCDFNLKNQEKGHANGSIKGIDLFYLLDFLKYLMAE